MITIEIDIGAGPRQIAFEPEDITIGFLEDLEEAQASGKWAPLRSAIASLLHLTRDEARAVTIRQFRAIAESISAGATAQATIPNG